MGHRFQVRGSQVQQALARLQPGKLKQVVAEGSHAVDFAEDALEEIGCNVRLPERAVLQRLNHRLDRRQGIPELVGDVAHKFPLAVLHPAYAS